MPSITFTADHIIYRLYTVRITYKLLQIINLAFFENHLFNFWELYMSKTAITAVMNLTKKIILCILQNLQVSSEFRKFVESIFQYRSIFSSGTSGHAFLNNFIHTKLNWVTILNLESIQVSDLVY